MLLDPDTHPNFIDFVAIYKQIAENHGVIWELVTDEDGKIGKDQRWDLCEMAGVPKPPSHSLTTLGFDKPTAKIIGKDTQLQHTSGITGDAQRISVHWEILLKSFVIRALFEKRSSPAHVYNGVIKSIRVLATLLNHKPPWQITKEDADNALNVARQLDRSGQTHGLIEHILFQFDENNLSAFCPIIGVRKRKSRELPTSTKLLRKRVDERRRSDRLPQSEAFWELLRIVLEEPPASMFDMMKFGAIELGILMGLRVEETATVPLAAVTKKEHVSWKGQSSALVGGIGHTLFLRHFSEKQGLRSKDSVVFAETSTAILDVFEPYVEELIDRIVNVTRPLRTRLANQIEQQRVLPEYPPEAVIPLWQVYTILTGNPFVCHDPKETELITEYKKSWSIDVLNLINARQAELVAANTPFTQNFRVYVARPENSWIPKVNLQTHALAMKGSSLNDLGCRVVDLEILISKNLQTKLSDTEGFPLADGSELAIADCLFLFPKRALAEGRNAKICDVTRYAFVGRLHAGDLAAFFADRNDGVFNKYGQENKKDLRFNFHSLRHMHNTELFAAGVADTIITHRFGRKSVAQSHVYDSRTLAQELAAMNLPEGSEDLLAGAAGDTFKLIQAGRADGPIVREFKKIQATEGDEAAIVYLAAEADGMQITPYGLCLNSFVADPCPKHLECFNGCCHLIRTGDSAETVQLEKLANRYRTLLSSLAEHPGSDAAKNNAKMQAESRLAGIETSLAAAPGRQVFPEGPDLSRPFRDVKMGGLIE